MVIILLYVCYKEILVNIQNILLGRDRYAYIYVLITIVICILLNKKLKLNQRQID